MTMYNCIRNFIIITFFHTSNKTVSIRTSYLHKYGALPLYLHVEVVSHKTMIEESLLAKTIMLLASHRICIGASLRMA